MHKIVVLTDEQIGFLKNVLAFYESEMGRPLQYDDTHDSAGALDRAEEVPSPTIQDWMMAKMAAKYRVKEFWDGSDEQLSAVQRWEAGEGADPEKLGG